MHGKSPLMAVGGTRPEVVKLFPVIQALRARNYPVLLVSTGQHADLAPRMLAEFGLVPDVQLASAAGLGPAQLLASILSRLPSLLVAYRPALLLVQGDTVSTLAGALAGGYARVPVAHVEAGLRTGNPHEPHPEEMHRQLVSPLASLHFAPTPRAAAALRGEGIAADRIHITGNSGIDALFATRDRLAADAGLRASLAARYPFALPSGRPLLLVTVHRRENLGERLSAILSALARLATCGDMRIVVALHPNPAVRGPLQARLGCLPNVHLLNPLDHSAMVWMMQRANLLLTDSGGLQEEAPSLGLRTVVLRGLTERPEAVDAGISELVPLRSDPIVRAVKRALQRPPMPPMDLFGDGGAGNRMADIVDAWLVAQQARPNALASPG